MKIKIVNLWKSNLGFNNIIFLTFASMPKAIAITIINFTFIVVF